MADGYVPSLTATVTSSTEYLATLMGASRSWNEPLYSIGIVDGQLTFSVHRGGGKYDLVASFPISYGSRGEAEQILHAERNWLNPEERRDVGIKFEGEDVKLPYIPESKYIHTRELDLEAKVHRGGIEVGPSGESPLVLITYNVDFDDLSTGLTKIYRFDGEGSAADIGRAVDEAKRDKAHGYFTSSEIGGSSGWTVVESGDLYVSVKDSEFVPGRNWVEFYSGDMETAIVREEDMLTLYIGRTIIKDRWFGDRVDSLVAAVNENLD